MSDAGQPRPPAPVPQSNPSAQAGAPSAILLIIQILLGLFLVFTLLVLPILGAVLGVDSVDDSATTGDTAQASAAALFISTIIFQFVQGSFPAISSLRRGSTLKRDWRFC